MLLRNIQERVFSETLAMASRSSVPVATSVEYMVPVENGTPVYGGNLYNQVRPQEVYIVRPTTPDYSCLAMGCCIFVGFWAILSILASM